MAEARYVLDEQTWQRMGRAVIRVEGMNDKQRTGRGQSRLVQPRQAPGGTTKRIEYTVNSDYTTADATFQATATRTLDGSEIPSGTVEIHNLESQHSAYYFAGKAGDFGKAEWDSERKVWEVYQQECEPAPPPTGYRPVA